MMMVMMMMTSRWSRRLTVALLCLDVIVKLTMCNDNYSGASKDNNEQSVNYRGSVELE